MSVRNGRSAWAGSRSLGWCEGSVVEGSASGIEVPLVGGMIVTAPPPPPPPPRTAS